MVDREKGGKGKMRRGRKWAVYLLIHYFATVSQPTFFFSLMIVESLILSLTAIQLYVAMGTAWSVIFSHSALGKTNTILVLIVCSYSFVSLNYSKHIFCFIILAQKKNHEVQYFCFVTTFSPPLYYLP